MTQEIGFVSSRNEDQMIDFEKLPVGKVLYLYQYHSCDTASRFPVKLHSFRTLRLFPKCIFPKGTNPDHVNFPNTTILNGFLPSPLDLGPGYTLRGRIQHKTSQDSGIRDIDVSGNM